VVRTAAGDLYTFLQTRLGVPLVSCPGIKQSAATSGRTPTRAPAEADPVSSGDEVEKNCAWLRGSRVQVAVYVDEVRGTGGLSQLRATPPADVHSVELFSGGTMIRVYTVDFIQRSAKSGLTLLPLPFSPGPPATGGLNRSP
jgi:hypothetical protein